MSVISAFPRESIVEASFSSRERLLVEKAEEAVRDGLELRRWCGAQLPGLPAFPLKLKGTFSLPNQASGFFGSAQISGSTRPLMACVQEVEFCKRVEGPDAAGRLREFVLSQFLERAHWTYANGLPGGFTIERDLFKTNGGSYGKKPGADLDWKTLRDEYAWLLLTVHIHDFSMFFGPFRKRFRVAAYVVG